MPLATCPTREELSSYALGKLPDDTSSELDEHLVECTKCQTALETLAVSADSLLADLQRPASEQEYFAESECREAMALVQAIGRDPSVATKPTAQTAVTDTANLGQIRDYKLLAKVGEGGMGAVYKALHTHLNKVVALKLLPTEHTADRRTVARFKREMLAVGALEHPNIVRATDAGEHDGVHFLVMEYVKGQDLSKISKQHGPLPVAEACELVRQAAVGLQHAHEHGLIHRDIKPSNLMLTVSDQQSAVSQTNPVIRNPNSAIVKILDLGLALLQEHQADAARDLTSTGQMMGTLDYMAPEQGDDSHEVDIRADIYALGATLYKLLCGEAPFGGPQYNTPVKKLMALATDEPQSIAARRDDLPTGLADSVHKMLAKDPDGRYATPAEVATVLAPFTANANLPGLVGWASPTGVEQKGDTSKSISASTPTPPTVPRHQGRSGLGLTNIHSTQPLEPPVRPRPDLQRRPTRNSMRRIPPSIAITLGVAALALIGALAVIFTIRTPRGTLVVEVDDAYRDLIRVQVTGGGEQVIISKDNGFEVKLAEGQYSVRLRGGDERCVLKEDTVEVTKGRRAVLKVALQQTVTPDPDEPPVSRGQAHPVIDGSATVDSPVPTNVHPDGLDRIPGLVGYWSFDEGEGLTVKDASGNSHHGTLKNMDAAAWMTAERDELPPIPGNRAALRFDGDDDVVTVPYDAAFDLDGPFTLSAWIRRPAEPSINRYERIIDHHFVNGYAFVLMNMKNLKGQTAMHIAGGNAIAYNSGGPSVLDGKWHHVVAICDGNSLRIYQDGKPLAKGRIKRGKPTTKAPVAFGNNASSLPGEEGFHGWLDDIRIYNRALSDVEIKSLAGGK